MPLWFVPRDGEVWIWTYAKSQKVRNLERDPRATVLVETGHEYTELRGAMIEAEAEIHSDFATVLRFAEELTLRYAEGISSVEGDARRRSKPRPRSGWRSGSGRCVRQAGITASSAAAIEQGPQDPVDSFDTSGGVPCWRVNRRFHPGPPTR